MIFYYLGLIVLVSVINFFLYYIDKQKAKKRKWRISEKTLLITSFFGGALGAIVATYLFKHKTKCWYIITANILFLLGHFLLGYFVYKNGGQLNV